MKQYLLTRILLIFPTLLFVSILTFLLSSRVSQDPVVSLLQARGAITSMEEGITDQKLYAEVYRELNLHKPDFYFSIVPAHYPKTLNSIIDPIEKAKEKAALDRAFFLPKFVWHGTDNRYHLWMRSILGGTFGKSIVNGQEVSRVVSKALVWTGVLSFFDLILSFVIGIFLGYYMSLNPKGRIQSAFSHILYLFYSIPKFWLATMFVVYFTTSDYGSWTNIFPSVGIEVMPGASTWEQVMSNLPKLILPVICLSIISICYISRLLRRSILNEMKAPYIMTAYAKGLHKKDVVRRHALPNALLPIITLLSSAIPISLAGSVVIEVIFNIPGVGRLLYSSVLSADWNVVFCIVLLMALVISISYLIGDVLYAYFNPQIRLA